MPVLRSYMNIAIQLVVRYYSTTKWRLGRRVLLMKLFENPFAFSKCGKGKITTTTTITTISVISVLLTEPEISHFMFPLTPQIHSLFTILAGSGKHFHLSLTSFVAHVASFFVFLIMQRSISWNPVNKTLCKYHLEHEENYCNSKKSRSCSLE